MVRVPLLFRITDLFLAVFGFAVVLYAWVSVFPDNALSLDPPTLVTNSALFCITFWVVLQVTSTREPGRGWIALFIEQAAISLGVSFILLALLTYFQAGDYNPLLITLTVLFSTVLLVSAELFVYNRHFQKESGVLLLGADEPVERLATSLKQPVLGVLDRSGLKPGAVPHLGELDRVEDVVSQLKPRHLVVSSRKLVDGAIPVAQLIRCRLHGTLIQDSVQLGETLARRIAWEQLDPTDFLLYPSLRVSRGAMAVQAIYTNLIGLALLMLFTPVLMLAALAVFFFSDRGPVLERIACAGFQRTPFFLLRFRTRRMDGSGRTTTIGALLSKLGIVHLPHLINIVRGELALCGPRPVRMEFARRIVQTIPFYSYRFTVKPGLCGLDSVHLGSRGKQLASENLLLSYDLYYVKHSRMLLDFEILISMLLGARN